MFNVILPTYNESENIVPMLCMLQSVLGSTGMPYCIVVVDNNSPDGTSRTVKELGMDNVIVIDRPGKMGLGSAYIAGLVHCRYRYTVILDSDLQHDPSAIPAMYALAISGNFDIVSGTRYAGSGMVSGWSFRRKLVSSVANTLARYAVGTATSDLTGSFRLYSTSALRKILPLMRCSGFGFQMEIIARAERMGLRIGEVPIIFYDREAGTSKLGIGEILMFLRTVILLYFSV